MMAVARTPTEKEGVSQPCISKPEQIILANDRMKAVNSYCGMLRKYEEKNMRKEKTKVIQITIQKQLLNSMVRHIFQPKIL